MKKNIGLGTWQFGKQLWGDVKDEESLAIIKVALENEITFIDTAPVYGDGHSETIVGKGIRHKRDKIFLATKCGLIHNPKGYFHDLTASSLEKEIYLSLKRLQTEYIDLYQIHWPDPNYTTDKALETLLKFKEKGLIKKIGVCNLTLPELQNLTLLPEITSVQLHFSLLNYKEQLPLLDCCHEKKLMTITYGTFQGGLLLDKIKSPENIPKKSAKNFYYQGKKKEVWENIQKIIKDQKLEANKKNISLPKQILSSTINISRATRTLIGCRTLKQLNEHL